MSAFLNQLGSVYRRPPEVIPPACGHDQQLPRALRLLEFCNNLLQFFSCSGISDLLNLGRFSNKLLEFCPRGTTLHPLYVQTVTFGVPIMPLFAFASPERMLPTMCSEYSISPKSR